MESNSQLAKKIIGAINKSKTAYCYCPNINTNHEPLYLDIFKESKNVIKFNLNIACMPKKVIDTKKEAYSLFEAIEKFIIELKTISSSFAQIIKEHMVMIELYFESGHVYFIIATKKNGNITWEFNFKEE